MAPIPSPPDFEPLTPTYFIVVLGITAVILVAFAALSIRGRGRRPPQESYPLSAPDWYNTECYQSYLATAQVLRSGRRCRSPIPRNWTVPIIRIVVLVDQHHDNAPPVQDANRLCVPGLEPWTAARPAESKSRNRKGSGRTKGGGMTPAEQAYFMAVLSGGHAL